MTRAGIYKVQACFFSTFLVGWNQGRVKQQGQGGGKADEAFLRIPGQGAPCQGFQYQRCDLLAGVRVGELVGAGSGVLKVLKGKTQCYILVCPGPIWF